MGIEDYKFQVEIRDEPHLTRLLYGE